MPEEIMSSGFLSIDIIVVVLALAAILVYSYTIGKGYGVTMLQALYISAFVTHFIPQVFELLPSFGMQQYAASLVWLGILFVVTFFILKRNTFFESPTVPSMWEIGVFGILFAGLAGVIIISSLSEEVISGFQPMIQTIFTGDVMTTVWVAAPILFWLVINGDT